MLLFLTYTSDTRYTSYVIVITYSIDIYLPVLLLLTIVFVEDNAKDPERKSSSTKSDNIVFFLYISEIQIERIL
jgi:hypothetical protein